MPSGSDMHVPAGVVAFVALLLVLLPSRAAEPTQRELLDAVEKQLKAVHEAAGPGLACVVVSRSEFYPKPASPERPGQLGGFDKNEFLKANPGKTELAAYLDLTEKKRIPDHGFCGGGVIDAAGLVLVNYHSIEGAARIYVHFADNKGSYADIHAADARSDLAVLKLLTPPAGLKEVKLGEARLTRTADGDATIYPGKLVVLMVNPYVTGFSLNAAASLGGIAAIRRRPAPPNAGEPPGGTLQTVYNYGVFLEHDARLNAGCSGGALLNLNGELIGLSTSTAAIAGGPTGLGYALPMDQNTRRIIDVLRRGEEVEYGFVGVVMKLGVRSPIILGGITPQSPAAAAGLRAEDVIFRIDDNLADNYEDLLLYLGSALAGTKVRLKVRRGGQQPEFTVTLAKFKHDLPYIASVRPDPVFGLRVDHGSILSQVLRGNGGQPIDLNGVSPGVSIRELIPDSPAAVKFKALGEHTRWLITQVNGQPVATPAEFYKAAKGQPSVKLIVIDPTLNNPPPREVTLP